MLSSGSTASMSSPVTYSVDHDGVGWIAFDDPVRQANVFDAPTLGALSGVIDTVEGHPPAAIVIVSGKDRFFIVGADLKVLAAFEEPAEAAEFARRGQRLFERIARLPVPVVCAIHGACAGGGYELALACRYRLASEAGATQIGLPETSIGTIPGWGGCVRLPRLIGAQAALAHILKGQLITATAAREAGMIDAAVPEVELKSRAGKIARELAKDPGSRRGLQTVPPPTYFGELRERTWLRTHGHQPALLAAIGVIERTAHTTVADALEEEAKAFGAVTAGPVCKALLRGFFLREEAKKRTLAGWFETQATESARSALAGARAVKRVGVIGAGVMGSGIAQWLAARGYEVVLCDVTPAHVERGLQMIRELLDEAVKRGKLSPEKAGEGLRRIRSTTELADFGECDLVIEAIVENVELKQQLFRELAARVRPDAILASNTSALPIEEIAGPVANPSRTIGIHFFNPVSRMPLVEIVLAPETSAETACRLLEWVKGLGKLPIICRSSPGFLVTRVLFFYLNEAVRLWESGLSTEAIDEALVGFGWPMGPLRLIDEVGVDVTAAIFAELAHYFPGRFTSTTACDQLLAAGLRGRKAGASAGFYSYSENGDEAPNGSIGQTLRAPLPPERLEPMGGTPMPLGTTGGAPVPRTGEEIVAHLMDVMIEEAERCLAEGVVRAPEDVDFALLVGAGFPAFRGGLMHYARSLSRRSAVSFSTPRSDPAVTP